MLKCGVTLWCVTADCVPILIYERKKNYRMYSRRLEGAFSYYQKYNFKNQKKVQK